ncbi:NUDIX hydrolase domain-like protein [Xylariales sp. PMI_506]|nr:NUDIX hydrolase domain-like protein [Xylariales sp. PMI_506]
MFPSFTIAERLALFAIPPSVYLAQHRPGIDTLVVGAVVAHEGRVLLIQRARDDYGGLCWEIPGGGCDHDDPTVLAAASRELLEETGLTATGVRALVDDRHWWRDPPGPGGAAYAKVTFLFDVGGSATGAEASSGVRRGSHSGSQHLPPPKVTLDPKEHEDFVWATEEDVRRGRSGTRDFTWISETSRQTVLKAFAMLRDKGGQQNAVQQPQLEQQQTEAPKGLAAVLA